MQLPALSNATVPGATNRFEDFMGEHITSMPKVHFTGFFYPWHRFLLVLYEKHLRECGYKGAQPYWDWELDIDNLEKSPIFNADAGFGSQGDYFSGNLTNPAPGMIPLAHSNAPDRTGGGCIRDGPFNTTVIHLGPGNNTKLLSNPRCIRRDLAPVTFKNETSQELLQAGLSHPTFGGFHFATEWTIHRGGHTGVGGLYGDMVDLSSSPADPLFYLHHANLDRVWWSWQMKDAVNRLADISGPLIYMDYDNIKGGNVTLDSEFNYGVLWPNDLQIRDVMSTQARNLCYKYDNAYS